MRERWFTDNAASGPCEIQPELTQLETDTMLAILAFVADEANNLMELMHCVDAKCMQVHDSSTGYKMAPHTQKMQAAMAAGGGVRLWHNHPSRESISHSDWECAGISESIEVVALNDRGSIFVGRIADWDDRMNRLLEWMPRLGGDLEFYMRNLARARGADADQLVVLGRLTAHVINRALATRMPVRYAYRFIDDETTLVASLNALGILRDGEAYAAAAIDDRLAGRE